VGKRDGKVTHVAADFVRVEAKLGGAEDHVVAAEIAAKAVDRLGERVPSPFLVSLRPEDAEQALTTQPPGARSGQESKQGKPSGRWRGSIGTAQALQPEPTERAQAQQVVRDDSALIAG
jgi:hypothetical protein